MAYLTLSLDDVCSVFDLDKAGAESFAVVDGELRIYVRFEGHLPGDDVELEADFKYHSDGAVSLLRLAGVNMEDD